MPVYQQPFYYRVYLDLDRDGSFETGEEITAYVMNVSIIRGMSGMRLVADVGKCVITLRNDDKRFTLSNTGSPYYNQLKTNVPVRVDVVDDTETYTIFRGVIYTIALQPGEKGTARLGRAVIECVDLMGILQAHRISLPLQSSKTPQYLINLITSAAFRTAYATNNITFSANPADADTVTINGTAYRFKTSIAQANDVAIGSTVEDTVDNLVAAVNGNEGSGTKYYANTTRPTGVTAAPRMTYYREVQADKPVRYYRLGESAGTTATDVGTNGRNGTYVNTPTLGTASALSGDPDTCVTFDGTNDYVDVPLFGIENQSFCFECWIKANATTPPALQCPISFVGASDSKFILYNDGKLIFAIEGGSSVDSSIGAISFGTWYHIAYTYDYAADQSALYINGSQISTSSAGPVTDIKTVAVIGAGYPGFNHWKGEIDEVAMYRRRLNSTDIARHYAARTISRGVNLSANARGTWGNSLTLSSSGANIQSGYASRVLLDAPNRYYRLGESAGTNADDLGADAQDGTYNGSPTLSATGAITGDPNTAVDFDGTNDYVSIPTINLASKSFTISLWTKPEQHSTNDWQDLFEADPGVYTGNQSLALRLQDDGTIQLLYHPDSISSNAGAVSFNTWHHIVATYNYTTDTSTLYVDGVSVASGSAGHFAGVSPTCTIGGAYWTAQGIIDEVAIWAGTALTATQVSEHYTLGQGTFSGGADGPTALTSYNTGISTISTAADRWNAGETNALDAIEDVVETERGLFWCASDGTLTFKGRDFIFKQASTAASLTLDSEHTDAEIVYDNEEVFNRIIVSSRPRSRLVSGVVAKATGVIQVPGTWGQDRNNPADDMPEGGSTVVRLPYVEQDSYKLSGAESLTLPLVASTDFQIYDTEDTSGFNYTNNGHVKFTVAINGSEIEVSLRNTALGPLYVQNLQVRGVGIIAYEPQETVVDDGDSQDTYGRRSLTIDLPLPVANNYNFARALAEYTLSRYKDPMLRARSIGFGNSRKRVGGDAYGNGGTKLYALDIGDVISLTDDQTGITSQKYMITSVRLRLEAGKFAASNIEFGLRRLDEVSYWLLEDATYGVLDSTTRLAL